MSLRRITLTFWPGRDALTPPDHRRPELEHATFKARPSHDLNHRDRTPLRGNGPHQSKSFEDRLRGFCEAVDSTNKEPIETAHAR
jgi:hypothetical protein